MTRTAFVLVLLGVSAAAFADAPPLVRTSLSPRSVTVGQPVTLAVDVLVPTYFTGAPRFPQLEVKDAVVVFLDVGGLNLNETIGETSYAGQQRSYLIYPQRPGDFEVPPFEVKVRYAIEAGSSPSTPVSARGIRFTAVVPEAARGLEHFVATPALQLTATTDRSLEGLKVGDSLARTITMTATDAFAMMLPPLSFPGVDGLGVYPAQPRVSDSSGERGAARVGKRVESVTYVLQKEGQYRLPAIDIDWWDTAAGRVRRASVPEMVFRVAPNPGLKAEIPLPLDPSDKPLPPDRWKVLGAALRKYGPIALFAVLALAFSFRRLRLWIRGLRRWHLARRKESDAYLERLRAVVDAGAGPGVVLAATYRFLDRREESVTAARLDLFAKESGDPALPGLAASLVESALTGGHDVSRDFVATLLRIPREPRAGIPAPEGLGPLNPCRALPTRSGSPRSG